MQSDVIKEAAEELIQYTDMSYQHRDSYDKDEMVLRPSYLYHRNSPTDKISLFWIGPQLVWNLFQPKFCI